jgi:hypothetical protein
MTAEGRLASFSARASSDRSECGLPTFTDREANGYLAPTADLERPLLGFRTRPITDARIRLDVLHHRFGNSGMPASTLRPTKARASPVAGGWLVSPSLSKSLQLVPGSNGAIQAAIVWRATATL